IWDRAIGEYLPDFKRTRFEQIRVRHLASHTSGFSAWRPLYAFGLGAEAYRRELARMEPESRPGASVVYSDLGTLVLGEILEAVLAAPLDRVFTAEVSPASRAQAVFGPIPEDRDVAPTEEGNRYEKSLCESLGISFGGFRTGLIRGEVHDGNAFYRG